MKKNLEKMIGRWVLMLGIALFFVQCETDLNGVDPVPADNAAVTTRDVSQAQGATIEELCACLATYPAEELTEEEIKALLYMREEEKLARDVYTAMFGKWALPVFENISLAEQRHFDVVGCLFAKYDDILTDPIIGKDPGEFTDPILQGMYDEMIVDGEASLIAALTVGANIEEYDLYDLNEALALPELNQDVKVVFEELAKGSRNHLRAFVFHLGNLGVVYEPIKLEEGVYEAIVTSEKETGGTICGLCINPTPLGDRPYCDGTGKGIGQPDGMHNGKGAGAGPQQARKNNRGKN